MHINYLQKRANEAILKISTWSATAQDKDAARQLAMQHGASSATGTPVRVYKDIVSGTTLIKDIVKFATRARAEFLDMTIPFDDCKRLLPSSRSEAFYDWGNERSMEFTSLVDNVTDAYQELKLKGMANLNTLAKYRDYPDAEEIRHKYRFITKLRGLDLNADNFYVTATEQELSSQRESQANELRAELSKAVAVSSQRLLDKMSAMASKLDTSNSDVQRRFHPDFLSAADDLARDAEEFNLLGDPNITQLIRRFRAVTEGKNVDMLKHSDTAKAEMHAGLEDILKDYL